MPIRVTCIRRRLESSTVKLPRNSFISPCLHHFRSLYPSFVFWQMKPLILPVLYVLLLAIFGNSDIALTDDYSGLVARPGGRSLLSLPKHGSRIGAALDGTVSLRRDNGNLLWKVSTGPPIYSSYQAPLNQDSDKENASEPSNRFSIECGNDWELYAREFFVKTKLPVSIEQFVKNSPYISDDGTVTLGSKLTTVFVVDVKTGRVIHIYKSPDISSTLHSNEANKDSVGSNTNRQQMGPHLLYIIRTDYVLQSFIPNLDKVAWNMTVADIGYAFLCRDVTNPLFTTTLNTSYEVGPEIGGDFEMPFACQSKGIVQRSWNHDKLDSSVRAQGDESKLSLPASTVTLTSRPEVDKKIDNHEETKMLLSTSSDSLDKVPKSYHPDKSGAAAALLPSMLMLSNDQLNILLFVILVFFIVYRDVVVAGVQFLLNGHLSSFNVKLTASKRKKTRKLGKNKHISSDDEDGIMDLNKLIEGGADGRKVGKLFVSNREIAKGSNGTIVLEGVYEGRQVAVKRLVKSHHEVALKEIQNLIASDQHPNIVRWYGVENDDDFVYLSLERCSCSLDDMIQIYSDSFRNSICHDGQPSRAMIEYKRRLDSVKGYMQDSNLWKASGHPSPLLLKLMRDVVSGLAHLHELGIIHRDLKPQNVLIIKERSLSAKLSDMGISRRLLGDMSSLGHHATGCGSSGWQAPEQLLHGRQTRAVDLFSLGCVLFFCITGGRHPFGDRLERDVNITRNQMDLFLLKCIPEAEDLISRLLNPEPQLRPSAVEVLEHPLFWSSETRISFLRDASDRVELEDRECGSDLLNALESVGSVALGVRWNEKVEPVFINNIGRYRRYRFDSVRDLLRVVRNKLNHYRELPEEIQELVGPVPDGFDEYFAARFPRLLIEVYKVVRRYCNEEECFRKYFRSNIV